MVRQYRALQAHAPSALQLRYEDAQGDFDGTLEQAARLFFPQVGVGVGIVLLDRWARECVVDCG